MMRFLKWVSLGVVGFLVIVLASIKLIYGGGTPYPDISTTPLRGDLETAIELPFPPGMVAVGPTGRVFFTYHPFHRPQDHTEHLVFEWVDNMAVPVAPLHADRLHGVFGITVDARGWLWLVRPGAMERRSTEVLALHPDTGDIEFEYVFPKGAAGFAQDLRVSADGARVFLADTGLLRFTSASLIVVDTRTRSHHIALEDHKSTAPQNWVMRRTDGTPYRLGHGLLTFQVGVDGLEISPDGQWLVFASMTHDSVFRVPTDLLGNPKTPESVLSEAIEYLGPGPMSDGIALTQAGDVVLTDVENGGLARLKDGDLRTLTQNDNVDWADSVSIGPNGDIWFTDSRLTDLLGPLGEPPSASKIASGAPYKIYRLPALE